MYLLYLVLAVGAKMQLENTGWVIVYAHARNRDF
jgi:hypothetical protein